MRRTGKIGLVAALLLAAASSLPEQASSQVPDAFDVRNSGFAPASQPFDTKSMLMTASTGWVAAQGMPGAFVGCPRPSPYMFGSNPGMFHYGWYMSPFDVRYSRYWFSPASRWYGGWGGWPGFGYGSSWPAAGPGAWGPWPGSSGMCGPGSPGSSFFWGAGGYGYGGYSGYGGFGGFGSGYPGYGGYGAGYRGYRGYDAGYPGSPRTGGGLGLDTGSGYIPESPRQAKGFRVIESRPTTGGADLRRRDPGLFEQWFEQFEPDVESARSATQARRDPVGDAAARGRASEQTSRESISDAIARTRAAERTGSAKTRPAPERTRAAAPTRTAPTRATPSTSKPERSAPARTAAPSSKPARAAPRSSPRPAPSSSARSAPKSSSRNAPSASPKSKTGRSGKPRH